MSTDNAASVTVKLAKATKKPCKGCAAGIQPNASVKTLPSGHGTWFVSEVGKATGFHLCSAHVEDVVPGWSPSDTH
jgi:hypothetical protein